MNWHNRNSVTVRHLTKDLEKQLECLAWHRHRHRFSFSLWPHLDGPRGLPTRQRREGAKRDFGLL
jgi:hypothetical protein